jgi:hypothetical protein
MTRTALTPHQRKGHNPMTWIRRAWRYIVDRSLA